MLENLALVLCGVVVIVYALNVYGVIAPQGGFARRLRAHYEYRSPVIAWLPFSARRLYAYVPFLGAALLAVGTANLVPDQGSTLVGILRGFAVGLVLLGFVAFLWPGPLMPRWVREADARRAAGLPPDLPPPEDLVAARLMTARQFRWAGAVLALLLVANVTLGGPPPISTGLLMATAMLFAYRAASHA